MPLAAKSGSPTKNNKEQVMGEVSASLKAARAVDGDDWFVARMKVLCVTEGIEYSQRLAYLVALSVADKIQVDEFMTVDTSGVDDNKLKSALTTQATKIGASQPTPSVAEQITALTARVDSIGQALEKEAGSLDSTE